MVFTETDIYILDGAQQDLPGFDEKYHNIVDYILKITDEIWEQRAIWVIYETYTDDVLIWSGAEQIHGIEKVVSGTIKTLSSFPDRKMNGEAVIWSRDKDQFFSSHRISSTATNLGATDFGPATGKEVFFRTIADCMIKENKIFEEWLVRDNLHLVQQLGFDPIEMAKKDQRYKSRPNIRTSNGQGLKTEKSLSEFDRSKSEDLVQALLYSVWNNRCIDDLENFYSPDFLVHAICGNELQSLGDLKEFLSSVLNAFSNTSFTIERITSNKSDSFTEVAVRWKLTGVHSGEGFFGDASQKFVSMPGITHFKVEAGKIAEEWIVFDGFDALCQIYADTKPPQVIADRHLKNKKEVLSFIEKLDAARNSKDDIRDVFIKYLSPDITLNITKPYNEIKGVEGFTEDFWLPLLQSFPDLENQPYILIGGAYEGRDYVSFTGNMIGIFREDWHGIPATNQPTWLRYAGHFLIENGKIKKAWYFFDMLDVMRQAGFNFFPARGIEWVPPIPMTGDGVVDYFTDSEEGQKTLDLTNAMLNALGEYDGESLDSMGQEHFWDVQNMMWYGPSGIGTTRGLKGFQDNHQIPFLKGFPDRGITPKKGKDYFAQIGDGNYSCDFGFPAMYGTHNGDAWLGLKGTGKNITLRVVDYWRREGDRLKENWVFIDMVDVLEQLGIDVFELLKKN